MKIAAVKITVPFENSWNALSNTFRPTETDAGYADSLDNKKIENSNIASVQNSLSDPGNRHSENYCNHSKGREMLYRMCE